MKVYFVGRVVEPELRQLGTDKTFLEFGLLSGRESEALAVWDSDKCFDVACNLHDGDYAVVCVHPSVTDKGKQRYYVQGIAIVSAAVRSDFLGLFCVAPVAKK